MEQFLLLADGTIIKNGSVGLSEGFLWLWLPGWTMLDASQKAFNPAVMKTIIYHHGEGQDDTYIGYIVCKNLTQKDNEVSICMVKG